jgi:glycosyltransferase involved in cell wall biosynthesis
MKALFVTNRYPPHGFGGYERAAESAVAWLRGRGHDVRVLTTNEGPSSDGVARELRWCWRDGEWVKPSRLQRRRVVRTDLAAVERHAEGCDVVAWWGMGGLPLAMLGAVSARTVGVVFDGWLTYGPEVDPGPPGFTPELVDTWLVISRAVLERARRDWPDLEAEILAPGVDAQVFPYADPRPWGWRLLYAGRIAEEKGVDVAVRALDELPEASLVVDGRGPLSVGGERVIVQESAPESLAGVYAEADCVVFPVVWPEPWGLVPLEAMSVGRPVIATGTGGSAEYLRDGVNALLVPPGDAGALAAAVRRLAGDPALRARLVVGGLETAARHSQRAFLTRLEAVLLGR